MPAKGYPVAYRSATARTAQRIDSFQGRTANTLARRGLPVPAPRVVRAPIPPSALNMTAAEAAPLARLAGRGLARFVPYLGLAWAAYEIYTALSEWWTPFGEPTAENWEGIPSNYAMSSCGPYALEALGYTLAGSNVWRSGSCGNVNPYPPVGGWETGPMSNPSYFAIAGLWIDPQGLPGNYGANRRTYRRTQSIPGQMVWPVYVPPSAGSPAIRLPQAPFPFPALDPASAPIGQPTPTPLPVPWPILPYMPNVSPTPEGSFRGYSIGGAPSRSIEPDIVVSGQTVSRAAPSHRFEPPGEGVKERKVRGINNGSAVMRLVGLVTEGGDFITALYKSLPEDYQPERKRYKDANGKWRLSQVSMKRQLEALYTHWDKVDVVAAINNVIDNQAEDTLIGQIGQYSAEAQDYLDSIGFTGVRNAGQPSRFARQ